METSQIQRQFTGKAAISDNTGASWHFPGHTATQFFPLHSPKEPAVFVKRLLSSIEFTLPIWIATAVYLILRFLVLGTIFGGYYGVPETPVYLLSKWLDLHSYLLFLHSMVPDFTSAVKSIARHCKSLAESTCSRNQISLLGIPFWQHNMPMLFGASSLNHLINPPFTDVNEGDKFVTLHRPFQSYELRPGCDLVVGLDARDVKGAYGIALEVTKPHRIFDQSDKSSVSEVVALRQVLYGKEGSLTVPESIFLAHGYYQVRARCISAAGEPVGEYCCPVTVGGWDRKVRNTGHIFQLDKLVK